MLPMSAFAASMPLGGLPVPFRVGLGAAFLAGLFHLLLAPLLVAPEQLALQVALKGSGVGLLALAAFTLPGPRWLGLIMALGALADMALAVPGQFALGMLLFAAGHATAIHCYGRHRRPLGLADRFVMGAILALGVLGPLLLPALPVPAHHVALYGLLLCGMAASLWASRFPRLAAVGALLFVASDIVLGVRLGGGTLFGPMLDDGLVWALYFSGQWLITLAVGRGLLGRAAHDGQAGSAAFS
jgi:uncharacterized membrane protein YhhN